MRIRFACPALFALALAAGCSPDATESGPPADESPGADRETAETSGRESSPSQPGSVQLSPESETEGSIALGPDLSLTVPAGWEAKQPRFGMIDYEYAVGASEGDEQDGRVTVMSALGGVEDNLKRWYGQFIQPDGSETARHAKVEKKTIAGQEVHLVDISGTYLEGVGPFAREKVERPGYRMLAAIICTERSNYYVKLYGPAKTVGDHEEAFSTGTVRFSQASSMSSCFHSRAENTSMY